MDRNEAKIKAKFDLNLQEIVEKTDHWITVGSESFKFSHLIVGSFAGLAGCFAACVDEICIHDEVVGGPKVSAVTAAACACVRCRCADGIC